MKNTCCEKCFDEGVSQLSYGGCNNSSCPCHNLTVDNKEVNSSNPQEPMEWESKLKKEFYELWNTGKFNWNENIDKPVNLDRVWNVFIEQKLKSQIKQAEERERERIVKEIEKMEKDYAYNGLLNAKQIITLINQNNE